MKYYTFYREDNKFDDILKDQTAKSAIDEIVYWSNHLMIGIDDGNEGIVSYITLKYGDDLVTDMIKDRTPIPNIDYIQTRKPK